MDDGKQTGLDKLIPAKKVSGTDLTAEEMEEVMKALDDLLGKLPEETINEFSKSKEFDLYKKLMSRYKK